MLVKILGLIDFLGALILVFNLSNSFPIPFILVLGVIFLGKVFLGKLEDFASWIDLIAGIILILSIFIQIPFLGIIVGLLLFQKAVFSFL
jgi:hypothetical protein